MRGKKAKQLRREYNKLYGGKKLLYNIKSQIVDGLTFKQFKKHGKI